MIQATILDRPELGPATQLRNLACAAALAASALKAMRRSVREPAAGSRDIRREIALSCFRLILESFKEGLPWWAWKRAGDILGLPGSWDESVSLLASLMLETQPRSQRGHLETADRAVRSLARRPLDRGLETVLQALETEREVAVAAALEPSERVSLGLLEAAWTPSDRHRRGLPCPPSRWIGRPSAPLAAWGMPWGGILGEGLGHGRPAERELRHRLLNVRTALQHAIADRRERQGP